MEYRIKTVGVLTSGGDSPGMNAAVRAVTRAAIYNNIRVKAIYRGYKGLILGEVKEFTTQDVSNIIQRGGTIIKSARSKEFMIPEGRAQAYETIKREARSVCLPCVGIAVPVPPRPAERAPSGVQRGIGRTMIFPLNFGI